jgi:hypothetical protein
LANQTKIIVGLVLSFTSCVCVATIAFAVMALRAIDIPEPDRVLRLTAEALSATPTATPLRFGNITPEPTVTNDPLTLRLTEDASRRTPAPRATPAANATPTRGVAVGPTPTSTPNAAANVASLETLLKTAVRERDLYALTQRLKLKSNQPIPKVVNATPPSYKVGDQRVLWVMDEPNKKHFTTTATLRYISPHVYAWVGNGIRVDDNALKKSVDNFENKIYPTNRQFFGSEWSPGVDNDVHINIFNGNVPGVGGYFSGADEYPKVVNQYSNEGEWFYINTQSLQPGNASYESVLAHEFQHMIHWNNDKNEDTWVNEGLSELAMQLNGYGVGGSDGAFVRAPQTQLNAWKDSPNASVPHYGAGYLFNAYFLERFGDQLMQEVVREPANGIAGYNVVLARNRTGFTFDSLFQDWVVANVLLDPKAADGRYAYKSLRESATIQTKVTRYPFETRLSVTQYGSQYIELGKPARNGDYVVTLQGPTSVKIAPTNPHSGQYVWYSNRGDDSNMTLTRAFDLRSVSRATLVAWFWYDIEKDYDYAYVEVSTDNGATWHTLKGQRSTDHNPTGNNFGNGFTARSEGWVEERFDLGAYAGKPILARFEYITDDAYNATGMLIDDVSIPELNYKDDMENGDGGWQADGFVRINNQLPQKFAVQLIKLGQRATVEKIQLDASNRAQIPLKNFGGDFTSAILIINGLTPVTTETASVSISVTSQ